MSASQSPSRAEIADLAAFISQQRMCAETNGNIYPCDSCNNMRGYSDDIGCEQLAKSILARLSRQGEGHDNGSTVAQGERERIKRILGSWPMHKDDRGPDNLVLADMLPGGYEEQDAMLGQIADTLLSQDREQSTAVPISQDAATISQTAQVIISRLTAEVQALTEKLERAREALEPLARLGPVFTEDQRRARTVLASLSDRPVQGEK
jgi:hypothetical protein